MKRTRTTGKSDRMNKNEKIIKIKVTPLTATGMWTEPEQQKSKMACYSNLRDR